MKILITTGIFPPDIGGPATYTKNFSKEFEKLGHAIKIISYGNPEKVSWADTAGITRESNIFFRYFKFFIQVLKFGREADLIYAFDILSSGLPTVMANVFLRKKIILRLGGDYFWEKAANSGMKITLADYYGKGLYPRNLTFRLINFILGRFTYIIFSTNFQRDIYLKIFPFLDTKSSVVLNPFPRVPETQSSIYAGQDKIFLFVGRLIKLKNLDNLIKIFAELRAQGKRIFLNIYGDGPEKEELKNQLRESRSDEYIKISGNISHQEVMEKIKSSFACILPSYSEISSNFALECLKLGKPIIITKENGLRDIFENESLLIDPLDSQSIKEAVLRFIQETDYSRICPNIDATKLSRSWAEVADDTINIINRHVLVKR